MKMVPFARFDEHGRYIAVGTTNEDTPWLSDPDVYAGEVDPLQQLHGEHGPVDMPPSPSNAHTFDFEKKEWVLDTEAVWMEVRSNRTGLLAAADIAVNRIEDNGGDAKAWRAYRQALRDITAQADPTNIAWPTPPKS